MKEKMVVTYSVQYCKEVELEINEETKILLDKGKIIDCDRYDKYWFKIIDENDFSELPIPTLCICDGLLGLETEEVEYVDGSFDIETFEKII